MRDDNHMQLSGDELPALPEHGFGISPALTRASQPIHQGIANELSVVATRLVEAARKALEGDRDATTACITNAVAILKGKLSRTPQMRTATMEREKPRARGGLATWQVNRIVSFFNAHVSRRIEVGELARLVDLSTSHFCRAFKSSFGDPPRVYMLRRRIEVAQGLMLRTSQPLSAIALSCGMCDQAHFTRTFHRFVGETPNSWRRHQRAALEATIGAPIGDAAAAGNISFESAMEPRR